MGGGAAAQPQPNVSANVTTNQTVSSNQTPANVTPSRPANQIPGACQQQWGCGAWSSCINGLETRSCEDSNNCQHMVAEGRASSITGVEPSLYQTCVAPVQNTAIQPPPQKPSLLSILAGPLVASALVSGIIGVAIIAVVAVLIFNGKKRRKGGLHGV